MVPFKKFPLRHIKTESFSNKTFILKLHHRMKRPVYRLPFSCNSLAEGDEAF